MNLFDEVDTPEGKGKVVGFPDHDHVEVRIKETGALLMIERNTRPLSSTGRPLTGIALKKHLAKQAQKEK